MRPGNLAHLYRVRLRARLAQECFAILGIAAGVALLLASQIATQSLSSSVAELSHGITGRASLQLLARDPHGIPATTLGKVREIPGVQVAAPLLEAPAQAFGPSGHASVQVIGADASLRDLGGALIQRSELAPFAGIGAILLPDRLAHHLGVRSFGQEATLKLYGRTATAPLYRTLAERQIGGLAASPIVIAPLFYAQEIAGLRGRITRILVQARPGSEPRVRKALLTLAAGRMNVEPADHDERVFANAAAASNQSTSLFALISALVGFLFAFNAMLLTVPQRRRLIADLRRDGYTPRTVLLVLSVDALVLGLAGCALGLVLGDELSLRLFAANPGYLGSAFALGSHRVVPLTTVLLAAAGGLLAASVAVLSPLRDILARDPLAAITPKNESGSLPSGRLAAAAVLCVAGASVVLAFAPSLAVLGMVALLAGMLLALPAALDGALAVTAAVARRLTGAVGHVASMELRTARSRTLGVAATGALAVFGAVAIQGAHGDLLHGLENASRDTNALTDIWVSPPGAYNLLRTAPFKGGPEQARIAHLPGVRSLAVYRGGLLDWGNRRVWVLAPPADAAPLLPPSQLTGGPARRMEEHLRAGGWVLVSGSLAEAHHLHVGESVTLPSPDPRALRIAGFTTNIGWAPGAIIINAADYAARWGSSDPSAYNIRLSAGAKLAAVEREIRRVLGPSSGLGVQGASAHAGEQNALSRQGLDRLTQIATLILLVAVLAMAAAIGSMVYQRRPRLAKLKLEGFPRLELWRTILLEAILLLGVGCATGALFGLYGQQLLDRALANVIDFPVVYSLALPAAVLSAAAVCAAALAVLAIPGYLAAGVAPAVALQD